MTKSNLIAFINKYYLAGTIEKSIITVEKDKISTRFKSEDATLLGGITMDNPGLSDATIGVYETSGLLKLMTALDEDINVQYSFQKAYQVEVEDGDDDESGDETEKFKIAYEPTIHVGSVLSSPQDRISSLEFDDQNTKATFVLADLNVLPDSFKNATVPACQVSFNVDKDFINSYKRSLAAIPSAERFVVLSDGKSEPRMVINYQDNNVNNIKFKLNNTIHAEAMSGVPRFNCKHLKEILAANYDAESGVIDISQNGLIRVSFAGDGFTSTYYMVGALPKKVK
jgi:hypothetical protein